MTGGAQRFDGAQAALFALAGVHLLLLAPHLLYPDLNWNYPFPGGDGLDWLANGLALAGEPVRYTGRAPLLPAVLAVLHRAGALPLFPLLHQAVVAALAWAVYRLLRAPCGRGPALALAVVTLLAHAWRASALEIMVEPFAVLLLTLACAAFLSAGAAPHRYRAAGLWGGLGALAQPIVGLAALPAMAIVLARRRPHLRASALWSGAALCVAAPALWLGVGPPGAGAAGIVGTRQLALLVPQVEGLRFYGGALIALVGWSGLAVALFALARLRREDTRFAVGLALTFGGFFILFYDYRAERFLLYLWPAWAVLAGHGLAALRESRLGRRGAWLGVALLVALGALWPPGSGWSGRAAWAARPEARAVAARRAAAPDPPPDPALHASGHSVVFVEPVGATPEERYATQYRLGNALRQRVKVVPEDLYPADWWGWAFAQPVEETTSLTLWRWQPPGDSRAWTLARPRRGPEEAGRRSALASAPPLPASLERGWWIAAEIDARVAAPDGFVAVCQRAGSVPEWLRLLPFALRSSSLFVVRDPGLCDGWAAAGTVESAAPGVRLRRGHHLGWPILAVFPDEVAPGVQ